MNKDKINIIYKMALNHEKITDETLKRKGFTDDEIQFLFDDDRLYVVSENNYYIKYTSDIMDYAKSLLTKRRIEREEFCDILKTSTLCLEFSPDDYEVNLLNFYKYINRRKKEEVNKEDVLNTISHLLEIANEDQIKDVKLLYFLFNHAFELPKKNVLEARFIKLEEIMLDKYDPRFERTSRRNEIRKAAYSQKYTLALSKNRRLPDRNENNIIFDMTFEKLLNFNADRKKEYLITTCNLAKENKFEDLIQLYNEENERRFISGQELYNLKLALKCIDYIERGKEYTRGDKEYKSVDAAIDNNSFENALELYMSECKRLNLPYDSSARYYLLKTLKEFEDSKKINITYVKKM